MQWKNLIALLSVFLIATVMFPGVNAENVTNPAPPGWAHKFDAWAGQKDMSKYNPVVQSTPLRKMDQLTVGQYPGVSLSTHGIVFPVGNSVIDTKQSSMKSTRINFIRTIPKQQAKTELALAPFVAPIYGYFDWYWTQDTYAPQNVTIQNFGPTSASGRVIFTSIEDGYSSSAAFTNLAPGANCTVSLQFPVIGSLSSVGIKPMGLEVRVDPGDQTTWSGQLAIDGIEKYNNDAAHLSDPDGGDNLEMSDLYHFPFGDGYAIIHEAAAAADNTNSPYDTASKLNTYTNSVMNYTAVDPYLLYAASDLYIENHGNRGVCDEFATMDVSFSRSLGIPSRFLGITWVNETGSTIGHGILENWINDRWVHSDPTWKSFNNSQVYKNGNNTHIDLTKYTDADDSRYMVDPYGDGLLRYEDMVSQHLGELPNYN